MLVGPSADTLVAHQPGCGVRGARKRSVPSELLGGACSVKLATSPKRAGLPRGCCEYSAEARSIGTTSGFWQVQELLVARTLSSVRPELGLAFQSLHTSIAAFHEDVTISIKGLKDDMSREIDSVKKDIDSVRKDVKKDINAVYSLAGVLVSAVTVAAAVLNHFGYVVALSLRSRAPAP